MRLRAFSLILLGVVIAMPCQARGTQEDDSLGGKIKRLFSHPSPTPRKRHSTTRKKTPTPTPTPEESSLATPTPLPSVAGSGTPAPSGTPVPTATPASLPSATPAPTALEERQSPRSHPHAALEEPVRPIMQNPHRHRVQSPPPGVTIPVPEKTPSPTPKASPSETPRLSPSVAARTATPEKKKSVPVSSISSSEILGYDNTPPNVRKLLDLSISLTSQGLGYRYSSADPANGGMDCSGFIHYVLSKSGMKNVPRDAREQYVWVRKAGNFQAVLARHDETFELEGLKPGDLLFWTSGNNADREPDVTQTMIYLGRERGTNQRIMVGASDGGSYKGQQRFGVSVFDFKVAPARSKASEDRPSQVFAGYARIPDFPNE